MGLKGRIAGFINQILIQYGLKQKELADALGVSLGSFSAYITGKELPRIDVLIRLAEIGGVTVDELVKSEKPPSKKDISINIGGQAIVGDVAAGNIYKDTIIKNIHKYTYQPGDLTEAQAAKLQQLVSEIVSLEGTVRRTPKTHAAVWGALKRRFKVAYYRKIREEDFDTAVAYLMGWRGRLMRPLKRKDEDIWRKGRYGAIFSAAKNQLGWRKEDVDNYIYDLFKVPSIKDLDKKQLDSLYNRIMRLKRRER